MNRSRGQLSWRMLQRKASFSSQLALLPSLSVLLAPVWGQTCCLDEMIVTYQDKDSSWISIALNLVEPECIDAVEALLVGDIVDEENSMCAWMNIVFTFIVSVGDGSEPLLTCSVPDLQFDILSIGIDCFESKIDSDSGHIVFIELVVSKPQQKATFSYWWVTNYDVLEEMIILSAALAHWLLYHNQPKYYILGIEAGISSIWA